MYEREAFGGEESLALTAKGRYLKHSILYVYILHILN